MLGAVITVSVGCWQLAATSLPSTPLNIDKLVTFYKVPYQNNTVVLSGQFVVYATVAYTGQVTFYKVLEQHSHV